MHRTKVEYHLAEAEKREKKAGEELAAAEARVEAVMLEAAEAISPGLARDGEKYSAAVAEMMEKEPDVMDELTKEVATAVNTGAVEVGEKVQALQSELSQTEVECATNEGAIVVKVTATQLPISVEISDDICQKGGDAVSAEVLTALKQARLKSGTYMQQRMTELYKDMGIAPGM